MEPLLILLGKACLIIAFASGVPLLITSFSGLVIAILQATTQIQEQSFIYLSKLLMFSAFIFFAGEHLLQFLLSFVVEVLRTFSYFGALV